MIRLSTWSSDSPTCYNQKHSIKLAHYLMMCKINGDNTVDKNANKSVTRKRISMYHSANITE
eukprot:Pgem_evm1s9102